MINDEGPNVRFNAAALFQVYDEGNNTHQLVALPGHPDSLDGAFPPGTDRVGQLVLTAPAHSKLLMILDGQKLSSQRSVFQIDPPKVTPARLGPRNDVRTERARYDTTTAARS